MATETTSGRPRLPEQVRAVNVGLSTFGATLREQGAAVVDVDWSVPAGGDPDAVAALSRLYGQRAARIEEANREVVRRLDEGTPLLVGVATAGDVVPGIDERTVLHPGPPLEWERFCDPLQRSVTATVMAEGWADNPEEADGLVRSGEVRLAPASEHDTVVPMAGTLGPSGPVWVAENSQAGNRGYAPLNQGPGKTGWLGVNDPEAVEQLVWFREVAGPILDEAVRASDQIDICSMAAQGMQMGDDLHMRVQASTNHFIRHVLPQLAAVEDSRRVEVARYLARNHLFFLTIGMAGAKTLVEWAAEVRGSSVVVTMARNGTTFGIRLPEPASGWFVAEAPPVERALYHAGYDEDDAAPDIGDSALLELVGLGGSAAAASPAIANFLGGRMSDAVAATRELEEVSISQSSRFKIPFLDFRGTPLGVDVRKVVELQTTPSINTGILHASEGLGQIGAGVASAPAQCFRDALFALDEALR